jgi:hypothetical protein
MSKTVNSTSQQTTWKLIPQAQLAPQTHRIKIIADVMALVKRLIANSCCMPLHYEDSDGVTKEAAAGFSPLAR